jgi:AraC-like DNA-binding protein
VGQDTVAKAQRPARRATTARLSRECSHLKRDRFPNGHSLIRCVRAYFATCLEKESPPRAKELSRILHVHRNDLAKAFQRAHKTTPSQFLKQEQIRAAQHLLATTSFDAGRIAYLAAFGSRRTFFRAFRRAVGVTPGAYRASAKCP